MFVKFDLSVLSFVPAVSQHAEADTEDVRGGGDGTADVLVGYRPSRLAQRSLILLEKNLILVLKTVFTCLLIIKDQFKMTVL